MKSRPIIFNAAMVRALLEGRKTQTRRVIKPQEILIFCILDDRIHVIHNSLSGDLYAEIEKTKGRFIEENSNIPEQRLSCWFGRTNLFADSICWLWCQGIRGLVSIERSYTKKRLQNYMSLSPEQESYLFNSSPDMYGVSWFTQGEIPSGAPFRWRSEKQQTNKLKVGDAGGKLAGQENSRNGLHGGKTLECKTNRFRAGASKLGDQKGLMQSKGSITGPWHIPGYRIRNCPFQLETQLWGRETWNGNEEVGISYRASNPELNGCPWKPSIHMPLWASRLTLRIKDIRVERVQNIKVHDCIAEGIKPPDKYFDSCISRNVWIRMDFEKLWNSINAKRGYPWASNPWVWVVDFEMIR